MKFGTWNHPKTGEVRIYINDCAAARGQKAYIASLNGEGESDLWMVKAFGLSAGQIDEIINQVEDELGAPATFGEVLAAVA